MSDGVNVAARLEAVADRRGIALSRQAYDQVRDRLDLAFVDKGEIDLKNIARPMQVFVVGGAKAETEALPLPDRSSIAVLPFQNMSRDPEQEYFADGMIEEIITALSRFKSLFVIARNSSFTYKGKAADIKQVGRELGVHSVLEGVFANREISCELPVSSSTRRQALTSGPIASRVALRTYFNFRIR